MDKPTFIAKIQVYFFLVPNIGLQGNCSFFPFWVKKTYKDLKNSYLCGPYCPYNSSPKHNNMLTIILVALTVYISWRAFESTSLLDKFIFYPYAVKQRGDYYRFITSGFVHADWMHLIFNMLALYSFGQTVELYYRQYFGQWGGLFYVALYFGSLIMSDVYAYWKYQDRPHYRSLGASGAVSGVVLSFILFEPWATMLVFFIPIKAVIGGVLYLGYSYYASLKTNDNIAHEAHLFGGLFGLSFTGLINPAIIRHFLNELGL